jgi:hypothetical protein
MQPEFLSQIAVGPPLSQRAQQAADPLTDDLHSPRVFQAVSLRLAGAHG